MKTMWRNHQSHVDLIRRVREGEVPQGRREETGVQGAERELDGARGSRKHMERSDRCSTNGPQTA